MTTYISTTDTAKLIRAALKKAYPSVTFSVRSKLYSMGSSIDVGWTDGPTEKQVESVAKWPFQGSSFDSMIDLRSPVYHTNEKGEEISYGPDHVFCNRIFSTTALQIALFTQCDQYNIELPDGVTIRISQWGNSIDGVDRVQASYGEALYSLIHGFLRDWTPDEFKVTEEPEPEPPTFVVTPSGQAIEWNEQTDEPAIMTKMLGNKPDPAFLKNMGWQPPAPVEPEPTGPLPLYTCELCGQEMAQVKMYGPLNHMLCQDCYSSVMGYVNRVAARVDRLESRAEKAEQEASAGIQQARRMLDAQNGTPVLPGHHSEKRHLRDNERIDSLYRRGFEKFQKAEKLQRRADAAQSNRSVSSDDPAAVLKLKEKLAGLETHQSEMKRLNALVRKVIGPKPKTETRQIGGTVAELNAVVAEREARHKLQKARYATLAPELAKLAGISETQALALLTPDFAGRIGYADYMLTNSGSEIRRLKQRIEDLQQQAQRRVAEPPVQSETHGDVEIVRDLDDNRLRLVFPGKPSREIITCLKSNGFHWSPSNKAWQRQLNGNGEYAAQCVLQFVATEPKG